MAVLGLRFGLCLGMQLAGLAFEQLADRNPGPGRDDVGHIIGTDLLLYYGRRGGDSRPYGSVV